MQEPPGGMCEAGRGQVDTPKYLPHCAEMLHVDIIRVLLQMSEM